MKGRVKKVFDNVERKLDAILIINGRQPCIDKNFFYFTGLEQGLFEQSAVVLFPNGNITIITSQLEVETAKKTNIDVKVYDDKTDFYDLLNEITKNQNNLGLNYNVLSHQLYCNLKDILDPNLVNISKELTETRMIKDDIEIKKIKKAADIADQVMKHIPNLLSEDMYEYELAAEIDYMLQKKGADKPAFETISSFGKNTSQPHYTHGSKQLKKTGDVVLCDFGANYKKYNSDITRTFVFGNAKKKQKIMYKATLEAQKRGIEKIKPGIKAHEIHDVVSKYINKTEFKDRFIHSTGHSLGLSVHDGNLGFKKDCEIKLQENMVITIEPGIYIPGYAGVRIEDDILIKKNGAKILTNSPKNLLEI